MSPILLFLTKDMLSKRGTNQYQRIQNLPNIQNITSYLSQQQKMFESERNKASFNKQELSYFAYGGKDKFQAFQNMLKICSSDPDTKYNPTFLHHSRADMMSVAAKKALSFHKYYPLDGSNETDKLTIFTHATPLSLHGFMFLTTLRNLCDPEQQKLFLQPALRGEIIGCYAQTELAHGSDVQNLLTTATYDVSSQSFIINTPEIGATKWWIGDLGLYCNHAVVSAQLIINQKKLGVHVFLVPIRDPRTLLPLKGIQVGDVGPKHAFNIKDNGYVIFSNFRIPRRNMLMRYHVVSKDGAYSLQGNQKISYATMLLTRAGIISVISNGVARIATIGTRYSLVRTQFKDKKGQEIPVLNYQTQQEKVIPRIAEAFAFRFIDETINRLGKFVFDQSKKGRFDRLNEVHILTSGIKAILSYDILRGGQIVRRAAGGHGFSQYSGIVTILNQNTPALTLQGQFTVLLLQVSRYLMKSFMKMNQGKPLQVSVRYLEEIKNGVLSVQVNSQSLDCPHHINKILMLHSCGKVMSLSQKFSSLKQEKYTYKQIQDHHAGILLNDAAIAHNHYLLYNNFLKFVQAAKDPKVKAVLTKLLLLFGIEKILERSGKYYETGTIATEAFKLLYSKRESLFEELRPEALSLVESFGYDDSSLMSAIGASNGKPYENLIEWAEKYNTLNRKEERDQIIDTIKKTKAQLKPKL